jgi:hypothetical protein
MSVRTAEELLTFIFPRQDSNPWPSRWQSNGFYPSVICATCSDTYSKVRVSTANAAFVIQGCFHLREQTINFVYIILIIDKATWTGV